MLIKNSLLALALCLLSLSVASAEDRSSNTTSIPHTKPLKVFILAGQSNMQGHANVSTLDYLADDPVTAELLKELRQDDGTLREFDNVSISSIGSAGENADGWIEQTGRLKAGFGANPDKLGPELTFGLTMSKSLQEPILIIKTAWGGKSLMTDFRPPSAGPRVFSEFILAKWKERGLDPAEEVKRHNESLNGQFYRHMISHVKHVLSDLPRVAPEYNPQQGYELAGFIWFQGFNDLVDSWSYPDRQQPGGYAEYATLLGHLIRDVRRDLAAPQLPFVIGVMGIGGERLPLELAHQHFRQAQASVAQLPEFKGNVVAVQTAPFWCDELDAIDKKRGQVSQMQYFLNSKHKNHANADGRMTEEQKRDYLKQFEAKLISPQEAALWKRGASNAGYHYLGCAKTFARIGQAFAEANLQCLNQAAE